MLDAAAAIPQQMQALVDPCYLVAYLCTRRAGKSFAIGLKLFMTALAFPGCSCLYLGLTKDSAIGIMNKDILEIINARFGIGAKWIKSDRLWRLPNGSLIYIRGADANAYEIAKVVGQKYRLAVLDEASKYRYNLHDMVYGSLLPAMGDDLGTIIMSGTPSNVTTGLFYDVTCDAPWGHSQSKGWSIHRWRWQDNVHKRDNIQVLHDQHIAENPMRVRTPLYKQEWLGEWVIDLSALVYKYDENINTAARLPRPSSEYSFILSLDLGFTDPTALLVQAYHPNDPELYLVHASKHPNIIIDTAAKLVKSLWRSPGRGLTGPYPFAKMIADAAALQSVEEMRQRHGLPLEAAQKTGKRGVIEVFNSDLQTGRVKVLPEAMDIVDEWQSLIWDEKKLQAMPKRWEEDPRFDNHLADCGLYGWRAARNYDSQPEPKTLPAQSDPNYGEAMMYEEMSRLAVEKARAASGRGPRLAQAPRFASAGRLGR